jgi:hypothetical protein
MIDRLGWGRPGAGCEFADTINRKVTQAWQDRTEVMANRDFQSATSFDHRDYRGNVRSGLFRCRCGSNFCAQVQRDVSHFLPSCWRAPTLDVAESGSAARRHEKRRHR